MSAEDSLPASPTAPSPRYGAFISYSHHDKLVARRLQRQLETYRLPKRLVGRATPQGPVPARLSPLFRDRDELNAGADLKASVQEALAASRWLIVVCSPDAARSPWVNREIIEFKRLHGEGRVLALIAAGEPFASNTPGREASECFPPALRFALTADGRAEGEPLEPIAADQRAEGDGPRRAALKLLAGMVGVGFDDLVQRDTQRRLRWLAGIASASAVGVVVFALLAVLAVRARNEAQHQRAQAEGLIEFMLGDLRKKLEPVGRLEVLDSVGEKALAYYGAQEAEVLDSTALGHRSRAMHLIGEIRQLRGNAAQAQEVFERAAQTTAQLLAQAPGDSQRLFEHAQSVFWVGQAAWKRGDVRTAEARLTEYRTLSEQLVRIDPSNLDWRAEVAFAHVNLGTVLLGTNRPGPALESLQAARDLLQQIAQSRPAVRFELAQALGWRAIGYEMLGDYERALAEQREKLALFRGMPEVDRNKTAQRGIQNALNATSQYQLALGRPTEATEDAAASLRIADRLSNEDPANLFWKGDACFARLRVAEVLLARQRVAEARGEWAQASECGAQVRSTNSSNPLYAVRLRARELALAAQLAEPKDRSAVAVRIDSFLNDPAARLGAGTPDRAKHAVFVAQAALGLGELRAEDDPDAARAAWRRAADELAPFADMADGAILTPLAWAKFRLGDLAAAHALAERIERSTYRHPAYVEFANKLRAARGGSAVSNPSSGARS
ncbi:TIR domain-containing protein [Rhizobacter sp. P5_C2]